MRGGGEGIGGGTGEGDMTTGWATQQQGRKHDSRAGNTTAGWATQQQGRQHDSRVGNTTTRWAK